MIRKEGNLGGVCLARLTLCLPNSVYTYEVIRDLSYEVRIILYGVLYMTGKGVYVQLSASDFYGDIQDITQIGVELHAPNFGSLFKGILEASFSFFIEYRSI